MDILYYFFSISEMTNTVKKKQIFNRLEIALCCSNKDHYVQDSISAYCLHTIAYFYGSP